MGDPLLPFEDVAKIVILVLIFGGWLVRMVFQSLGKPVNKPRGPANQPGPPAKGLREFLEEIRQEEAGGGRPAAAPAERGEELVWEEVDEPPFQPHAEPQAEKTAFDLRREQWKRETERRRAERARQREERARRRRQEPAEEEAEHWTSVAERRLDSKLDERHVGSHLDSRQLESRLSQRQLSRLTPWVTARPTGEGHRKALVGALRGLTLRDLVLAEVILGKPRSKKRHIRDV